jgi:hypothetical protein
MISHIIHEYRDLIAFLAFSFSIILLIGGITIKRFIDQQELISTLYQRRVEQLEETLKENEIEIPSEDYMGMTVNEVIK